VPFDQFTERWPPIYDADDLARTIADLASRDELEGQFYQLGRRGPSFCQGDIVRLESAVPAIGPDGEPILLADSKSTNRRWWGLLRPRPAAIQFWLVIGNTCDLARSLADVSWTQLVPIFDIAARGNLGSDQLAAVKSFRTSRRFYIPPWSEAVRPLVHVAELLLPVACHKRALDSAATVEARMSRYGWVLLHSCLVRFLARDDGRFSPD